MNGLRLELTVGAGHALANVDVGRWLGVALGEERFSAQVIHICEDATLYPLRRVVLDIPDIERRLPTVLKIDAS